MKMPRFRIAWLMVAVAIAGIDFGVIRTLLAELFLVMGALSMANVLVVGLLIAQQRPSSRPFLWGFEVFGAMALALLYPPSDSLRWRRWPDRLVLIFRVPSHRPSRRHPKIPSRRIHDGIVRRLDRARRSATRLRSDWWFPQSQIQNHHHASLIQLPAGTEGRAGSSAGGVVECQGTERSLNAPRRAAHDAGVEVSGSAVSVPRLESLTKGKRIAAPTSVAPISKVLSGCA